MLKFIITFFFGCFYLILFKYIQTIEEKVLYYIFLIFYFLGGSVSWISIHYKDIFYEASGFNDIELGLFHICSFTLLVYILPILSLILIVSVRDRLPFLPYIRCTHTELNMEVPLKPVFIFLFVSILYLLNKIDFDTIINPSFTGYTESLKARYALSLSPLYVFIGKSFIYFLTTICILELFKRSLNKTAFVFFVFSVPVIVLIDSFIFISKLSLGMHLFIYMIVILLNGIRFKSLFVFMAITTSAYLIFINTYAGGYRPDYHFEPIVKAITRFTITTPYFLDYFYFYDFNNKVYFDSVFRHSLNESPNVAVYNHMFSSVFSGQGQVASSIFVYNYTNYGPMSVLFALFEILFIYVLYRYSTYNLNRSVSASLFIITCMSILNYNFVTILINPLVGIFLYLSVMIFHNLLKNCFFPTFISSVNCRLYNTVD